MNLQCVEMYIQPAPSSIPGFKLAILLIYSCQAMIPDDHLAQGGGRGIPRTDYIVYVTSYPTPGEVLAYAGSTLSQES